MTTPANRAARRLQARKDKNRKNGLAALSLLAATGLMSSYVSIIRNTASFAAPSCELEYEVNKVGGATEPSGNQFSNLNTLSTAIDSDLNSELANPTCVLITFVDSGETFTGQQLEFINSAKYTPGEVFVYGNNTTLDGTTGEGSAQIVYSDFPLIVKDIDFIDGAASSGGAIYGFGKITVIDSSFSGNTSTGNGGAIYGVTEVSVSGSTFSYNSASQTGGAIYSNGNQVTVTDSTFTNNISTYSGGAIAASGPVSVSNQSVFTSNSSGEGGAILSWSSEGVSITGSSFTSNTATSESGGAVYAYSVSSFGSTFTNNTATGEGGAIHAFNSLTVVESTFDNNDAWGGGAIALYGYRDQNAGGGLVVFESTFTGNSANYGGAVLSDAFYSKWGEFSADITNATFTENVSTWNGGAISADGSPEIRNSTFDDNSSGSDGGAISSNSPVVVNSTFFSNSAGDEGGAIDFNDDATIAFSTFLDNSSVNEGAAINSYEGGSIFGNILADSNDGSTQVHVLASPYPNAFDYNLSTGVENVDSWDETNETVTFSELSLASGLSGNAPQTISIQSAQSAAVDFVPRDSGFTSIVTAEGTPFDQRDIARQGALDAGAFEFGLATAAAIPAPPFTVLDAKPINTQAGNIVQATGVNLTRVTEVYVNGIKVEITSRAGSSLSFIAPAGLTGLADVRFVGAGHEITLKAALNFAATAIAGDKVSTVVPGFRANSSKLTRPMKKAIRAFLKANPELTTVTCKGFTSAPATPADLRLARQRGKATCDFIQKLNPELTVKVLKGSHTNTPGQQIRRVRIVME